MKGYIQDKEFGKVYVELRRGMTSVRFTYHPDGHLLMRAPLGSSATHLQQMLDINREQLRLLPQPQAVSFRFGQVMECFRCRVVIEPTNPRPGYLKTEWDDDNVLHVTMHESTDLDEFSAKQYISDRISEAMGYIANKELLPFAREVAELLGLKPAGFEIGRGMRKLGHCSAKKVIQLSRNLMFLPEPLVRYIICHELAHLTHMNHSPLFHTLCNEYCGGHEKELERQLRQFHFPILK